MRPPASSPRSSRTPARPGAEYPFGRARGSFFLGGAEHDLPELDPARPPLLAYGANASPQRLARKLPGRRIAALAGRLHGWAVVHSAHVSPYGAVPATIVPREGAAADVHVLVGDDLAPLDATEPNYDRVRLEDVRLEVDRLGALGAVEAYVSRWGPLTVVGRPIALGGLTQPQLRRLLA